MPDDDRGMAAMDLKTRAVRWLQPANGIAIGGIDGFYRYIDGFYRYGDSFLAVQNGVKPARVVRFDSSLTKPEIVEAKTPGLGEPTHGHVGGWDAYDDGNRKPNRAPLESQIRKIVMEPKNEGRP